MSRLRCRCPRHGPGPVAEGERTSNGPQQPAARFREAFHPAAAAMTRTPKESAAPGLLRRAVSMVACLALAGPALSRAITLQRPTSGSYEIPEWTWVQAQDTRPAGIQYRAQPTVAHPVGNQAKSTSFVTSFNFLTDEFEFLLAPPTQPFFAELHSPTSVLVRWTESIDTHLGLVDGYEIKIYEAWNAPDPTATLYVAGGTTASHALHGLTPGTKQYAAVEATNTSGVHSAPSPRIMFVTTAGQATGDVNGDGITDGLDLIDALFALGVGSAPGHNAAADINGNMIVDQSDVDAVIANLGSTS